jgi:hypothetical protein
MINDHSESDTKQESSWVSFPYSRVANKMKSVWTNFHNLSFYDDKKTQPQKAPFYAAAFELQQEKPNLSEIEDLLEKGIQER